MRNYIEFAKYRGFFLRQTEDTKWEVVTPIPLQDHLTDGMPIAKPSAVCDTEAEAKAYVDEIHERVSQ